MSPQHSIIIGQPCGKMRFFNLLALRHVDMAEQAGEGMGLQFEFSGGSSLRLLMDEIDITLADLDAGHPTSLQPAHDV
jgi:hypothetical protein